MSKKTDKYTFADALAALQIPDNTQNVAIAQGFSDLDKEQIAQLEVIWPTCEEGERLKIVQHLRFISESTFEFDYSQMAYYLLDDPFSEVRLIAIDLLWDTTTPALLDKLIHLIQNDSTDTVRAKCVSALGRFILLGEYEDISPEMRQKAITSALSIWEDESEGIAVRRRALEALSNSSLPKLDTLIQAAYEGDNKLLRVSAVYAMGRSCNPSQWGKTVIGLLQVDDPEFQYEAVRAAGELELVDAVEYLSALATNNDEDIQSSAIWALGEIGGEDAIIALESLRESLDSEEIELQELIDDAISSAELSNINLIDSDMS